MKTPCCYKRGEDKGCFAFLAGGRTKDASLLLHGRRGNGFSCSPLPRVGEGLGVRGFFSFPTYLIPPDS